MFPQEGIEPRCLINFWFQVQHYSFWANWAELAQKTETLGSLYSHALLILNLYDPYIVMLYWF